MPIFIVCVLNMYKVRSMQQLYLSLDEVYRALSSQAADAHSHFLIATMSFDNQEISSHIAQAGDNISEIKKLSARTDIFGDEIVSSA